MVEPAFQIPKIFSLRPSFKPDCELNINAPVASIKNNLYAAIPSDEAFIGDGKALLDASASWQAGRVHQGIKTFQHRQYMEEAGSSITHLWYALVSVLHKDEISFRGLWSKRGTDKMCKQKR
jgi:hypothetical protein